jgi:hypothetical protein
VNFSLPGLGSTFTALFPSDTNQVTTIGTYTRSVAPGAYTLSGTFVGPVLTITFMSPVQGVTQAGSVIGGIEAGTVDATGGPVSAQGSCSVTWTNTGSPTATTGFSVTFTVIQTTIGLCPS